MHVLTAVLNRNLSEAWTRRPTKINARIVTLKDTRHFVSVMMQLVTMKSAVANNMRTNFGNTTHSMGLNRFKALKAACVPSDPEFEAFEQALRTSYQTHWIAGTVVVVDESVWAYRPGKSKLAKARKEKCRIPLVYIPRKPNPNGLMAYHLVSQSDSTNLPFAVDFTIHRSFPQLGAIEAARTMVSRWTYPTQMELVGDSAFGSFSFLSELVRMGHHGTFSMPASTKKHLWKLLARGTQDSHWNAALMQEGFIYALIVGKDDENKRTFHRGLSSSFIIEAPTPGTPVPATPASAAPTPGTPASPASVAPTPTPTSSTPASAAPTPSTLVPATAAAAPTTGPPWAPMPAHSAPLTHVPFGVPTAWGTPTSMNTWPSMFAPQMSPPAWYPPAPAWSPTAATTAMTATAATAMTATTANATGTGTLSVLV